MKLLVNREILRRLALAAGLILSIIMFTAGPDRIYLVEQPDFQKMRQADEKRQAGLKRMINRTINQKPGSISPQLLKELKRARQAEKERKPAPKLTLEQYILKRTKGLTKDASGPQWRTALENLEAHFQGRTPAQWKIYVPTSSSRKSSLYFPVGTEPFAQAARGSNLETYLSYPKDGKTAYLSMLTIYPREARGANPALLHPWRTYFLAPFALGLVLYLFLIPKVKKPAEAWGYARLGGVMVSDFFSLALGGPVIFFGFAALASNHGSLTTLSEMDGGPLSLTLILWAIGLALMGGLWFGVSYRNFWIRPTGQGLEHHTARGSRFYAFKEMDRATLKVRDLTWMRQLTLLLGGTNAGTVGMVLSQKGALDIRIKIDMKDGRTWRIKPAALKDPLPLVRTLKDNGVRLDDDLAGLLDEQPRPDHQAA